MKALTFKSANVTALHIQMNFKRNESQLNDGQIKESALKFQLTLFYSNLVLLDFNMPVKVGSTVRLNGIEMK